MTDQKQIAELEHSWANDARWKGITRHYGAEEVVRLRGTLSIEFSFARQGAERLWHLIHSEHFVRAPRRCNWQPGSAAGASRSTSHLFEWLASGSRCQHCQPDLPRPEPLPVR